MSNLSQQKSPMLFDLDSPHLYRFRKLSNTISAQQSIQSSPSSKLRKSLQKPKSALKVSTIKIDQVHSGMLYRNQDQQRQDIMQRSDSKPKRVQFHRQYSQPLQLASAHNNSQNINVIRNKKSNALVLLAVPGGNIQSSNNNTTSQNVRKRMTSLQKYFQQTRSIQLPYKTQNRLHDNTRFLQDLDQFQARLSRKKKNTIQMFQQQKNKQYNYALTQRINYNYQNKNRYNEISRQNKKQKSSFHYTQKQPENHFLSNEQSQYDQNNYGNNIQKNSSQIKKFQHNRNDSYNSTRLRELSRPKKLQIQQLESHNIKKYKRQILIQKILKQKLQEQFQYRQKENQVNIKRTISEQISQMQSQLQDFYLQIKRLKRQAKYISQKKQMIKKQIKIK